MERIVKNKIGVETKIFAQTFEFEAYSQIKKLAGNLVFEREYLQIPAVKDGENEVNN